MTKEKSCLKRLIFRSILMFFALSTISTTAFAFCYPERYSATADAAIELATTAEPQASSATRTPATMASAPEVPEPIPLVPTRPESIPLMATIPIEEIAPEPAEPKPTEESKPAEPESHPDRKLLAKVIHAEAGNQCFEGQVAVGLVVTNRVKSALFPNSIPEVIYEPGQFSTVPYLDTTIPSESCYEAADAVLNGTHSDVLPGPKDGKLVLYFSRNGENSDVAAVIEDHIFCYSYYPEP